ncbi:hypothetical protein AJ87_18385 [Rhizobium yanglingense]|nr:hypothetical protein AJ87_18385 [Rhizobium yanglingense]
MDRGQIDSDHYVSRPADCFGAGLLQHPGAERTDKAYLFGERDEIARHHHATLRMPPSQQSFEAAYLVGRQIDERLVEDFEFAKCESFPQIEFERTSGLHPGVHRRLEEPVRASSFSLGAVKRHIGVLQEMIEVVTVSGCNRNSHTRANDDLMAADIIGLCDCRNEVGGESDAIGRLIGRNLHYRKFVTPQACDTVCRPHTCPDPVGHRLQKSISNWVTERVVHFLEVIEIETENCEGVPSLDMAERTIQVRSETDPVGQIGQRVVVRKVLDLRFRLAALGDVLVRRDRSPARHWLM